MLDPLTQIAVRMFVPIHIGSSQFMVDVLGDGERRQRQKEKNEGERYALDREGRVGSTHRGPWYHTALKPVKMGRFFH